MRRVAILAIVLTGTASVSADPPTVSGTSDLSQLQGHWKPLQCEYEGQPQMPSEVMEQIRAVFDRNEYHLYFRDSKQKDRDGQPVILRLAHMNVTLDETTSPKTIVFEFLDGPLKGTKRHGIYELAGNQLRLCYCATNRPKPTKFETPAQSGYFLETWARQEKK
jgi:uncharacterized protein (TIGR03067 family)